MASASHFEVEGEGQETGANRSSATSTILYYLLTADNMAVLVLHGSVWFTLKVSLVVLAVMEAAFFAVTKFYLAPRMNRLEFPAEVSSMNTWITRLRWLQHVVLGCGGL